MPKSDPRLPTSIAAKMIAAVSVSLIIVTTVFILLWTREDNEVFERQVQSKAHVISEFGRELLEHLMLEGNHWHVNELLATGAASRGASSLFVLRTDGTIVFSSDSTERNRILPIAKFSVTPSWTKARFLSQRENDTLYQYIINPIENKPACGRCHPANEKLRGFFGVKSSLSDLEALTDSHRTKHIMLTAVSFLGIGVVIFVTLFLFVTRPLSRLQIQITKAIGALQLVEQGKEQRLVPLDEPHKNDEVGSVTNAFNHLVRKLNDAHDKLRLLHQAELQQADRLAAAGEMAAIIAHEIRNPMAGVLGALKVMSAEMRDDNPRKDIFKEMVSQLERMNDSLSDLLSYAKPALPVISDTDVNGMIERTLTLAASKADASGITTETHLDPGLPTIPADQRLLQQVLWNIVQNSLQAMTNAGTLTITTAYMRESGGNHTGSVSIVIRDSGVGISASRLQTVFDPFYTTKVKGTGLGLAVSKQIVEQHHGTITIESEAGAGTAVTIVLPAGRPPGV